MTEYKELALRDAFDEELTPLEHWLWHASDTTVEWRKNALNELLARLNIDEFPVEVQEQMRKTAMLALALENDEGESNE